MNHTEGPLHRALLAAIRAPSPYNTQPWRFEVRPDRIDVLLDRERVLAVTDPDGHEARLSCGAAVLNIRLSLLDIGRATVVRMMPDSARPDLLASVRIAGNRAVAPSDRALAAMIERRNTNRRPFLDRPVPPPAMGVLVRAAEQEGARLRLVERPAEVDGLAALVRRADHLQSQDPLYQAELRAWVHDSAHRADGISSAATGPPPRSPGLIALRQYGAMGESTMDRPFERQPMLAVLTTPGDTPLDQVQAGQAMQRVLLSAADLGLCASFLAQPIEIPAIRAALRALLTAGHPHVVLRLGYGYSGSPTSRRPLEEVVDSSAHEMTGGTQ
jgi:nitroreductase